MRLHNYRIFRKNDNPEGWALCAADAGRLKEVFAAFDNADQWHIKVLDAINDGILVCDETTIVIYVNSEYTRITGVAYDDIVGRQLLAVRPGAMLPQVMKSGKPLAGVYRREGDIEYVVDMAPIIVGGETVGGVSIVKDITEVQKLSEEVNKYAKKTDRLKNLVDRLYRARYTFEDIIGGSFQIVDTIRIAKRAARGEADILITGESGTGKEVFAQAIHNASSRAGGPFVALNCAAIAPALIESELFGYEEGSFTGAKKGGRMGLFEIASGGTIFLDEIAELSPETQAKLLRVLQEKTIRRIGEAGEIPVDIRIIAATNRDLAAMVRENKFRADVYYRLNVLTIHLPPLRERIQDVGLLAEHFFSSQGRRLGRSLSADENVMAVLFKYSWPGNVRELRNVVEYAVNMCDGSTVTTLYLPPWLQGDTEPQAGLLANLVQAYEKKVILSLVERHGATSEAKRRIAKQLGISLATLYNKLKKNDNAP